MIQTKDFLLLIMVTFMSIVFILPEDSILRGLDRIYIFAGLMIVVSIALSYYPKFVVVAAVMIVAIGANLPQEIASLLRVDINIFMITLVLILILAVAKQFVSLPTGLDKPQGFPEGRGSVAPNPNIVELNLPEDNGQDLNAAEDNAAEPNTSGNNNPEPGPDLKNAASG